MPISPIETRYAFPMPLDLSQFTPEIAALLRDADTRLMPLTKGSAPQNQPPRLLSTPARNLFPQAGSAEAPLAGLLLYLGFWNEAHEVAQSLKSPEGSYWHAIVHRMEPDAWNSKYWFKRIGEHAIFPDLLKAANAIAAAGSDRTMRLGSTWNPSAFVDFCEEARRRPGSSQERIAMEIQQAEWELLIGWCACA
jgi:hypothetical protein